MTIKEQRDKLTGKLATEQLLHKPSQANEPQKNSTSAIDTDVKEPSLMPEAFKNHFLLIEMQITGIQNKLSQMEELLWDLDEGDTSELPEIKDLIMQYKDSLLWVKKIIKIICIMIGVSLCLITLKVLF